MSSRWQPSGRTLLLAAIAVFGIGTACAEGRLPTDPGHLMPSVRLSLNARVSSAGRAMKLTASYAEAATPTVLISFFTTTVTLTGDETELPIRIDIAGCVADPARELPADVPAVDLAQTCVIHLTLALLDADGKQIDEVVLPPIAAKPGAAIQSPPVELGSVVTSVAVLPRTVSINALTFTSRLNATVTDNFGTVIPSAAVTWTSIDPTVATVDNTGVVTARAVGATRIVATSRDKVDTATVTVRQLIKSVTITGAPASIQQGDSVLVGATVRDSADVIIPPTGAPVTFSSSDAAVLNVDAASGRVRAIAVGTASVRATSGSVTTAASIVVRPIPIAKVVVSPASGSIYVNQTFAYAAQPQDASGASLPGRVVTWSSSDTTIATVAATGVATAKRAGSATISATSEGVIGAATLNVSPAPATQLAVGTQPGGAITGSVLAPQPVIQVRDSAGGIVVGSSAPVTATLIGAGGALSGTMTVNAVNGIATFTNLVVTGVGSYTITFTSGTLTPATSGSVAIVPLPAKLLIIATQPVGALTGAPLSVQPVVQVRDTSNAIVAGATNVVTAALGSGSPGTLSGTTTAAAVNGVASFTDLRIMGAGSSTIVFTAPGLATATSSVVITAPLPAVKLGVTTQPGSALIGSPLSPQPAVSVLDSTGGVATGSSAPVTATLVGASGTLSGTTTVNAVNGVATFTDLVVSGQTGSYSLSFTAGSLAGAASDNFTVSPLPASQLGVATQPGGAVAGSSLAPQPVVLVRNSAGGTVVGATNVVTATLNGSGGTLWGTTTVTAVDGVATFTDLVVSAEGTYTLTFASSGITSTTSNNVVITPRPASKLGVVTEPGGAQTGAPLAPQPVVQVRNAIDGKVAGATNAVTATLIGSGGTLSGTTTVNAVDGVATFTDLVVSGPGTYSIAFSAASLSSAMSSSIGITRLAAKLLAVTTEPVGSISGNLLATQPVVEVRDSTNATVIGATNLVTAALSGAETLSGTTTVAAVNGVATFTDLRITGAGSSSIVFTATGLTPATSSSIATAPPPATKLAIGTQPGGAVTASPLSPQPVIQVQDADGGVVVGSSAAVTATLNGSGGTLSGTTTVNAVNGIATFTNLVVTGPGIYTLSFASGTLTGATSSNLTITPPPPTQLALAMEPGGAQTGSPLAPQPVVEVRTAGGGVVVGARNAVTATLNGAGGTLSGTTTINAVSGIATFTDLVITGPGNYRINFSSGTLTPTTSGPLSITPLPASKLAIGTQPGGAVTRSPLSPQPVIQVQDASGGIVNSSTEITASLNGDGILLGTTTATAVNGIATFTDLRISGPGSYTLTFSAAGAGLTDVTSAPIAVTPLPAVAMSMRTQPGGAETGFALSPQPAVDLVNADESIAGGANNPVTVELIGDGTLSGTTTVNAVNGTATFTDLVVYGPGTYQLRFTSPSLGFAQTGVFTMTPHPATLLSVATQPGGAQSASPLSTQPVILVRDSYGGVVAGATPIVTATLNGAGTLSGTTSVVAVDGVATFTDLVVTGPGTYSMTFRSSELTSAISTGFTITPIPAPSIGLNMGAAPSVSGVVGTTLDVPIVADMSNAQGQVLASLSLNVTWDPTKFDFVSVTNGSFGASPAYFVNVSNAIYGTIAVSMFDNTGFSSGVPLIYTVTLRPKTSGSTSVTSTVTAAGDDVGRSIPASTFIVRPVAVTTP